MYVHSRTIVFRVLVFACLCACVRACVDVNEDDMGWGEPGLYPSTSQHGRISTPNLDEFGRSGMRFTNAYAGYTVCAPSRTTLMTGFVVNPRVFVLRAVFVDMMCIVVPETRCLSVFDDTVGITADIFQHWVWMDKTLRHPLMARYCYLSCCPTMGTRLQESEN